MSLLCYEFQYERIFSTRKLWKGGKEGILTTQKLCKDSKREMMDL
ncbi:hypothetical protein HMPREF3038_02124 [Akkermansia sp. KLE1797]|nr:hypothetical protein HMPREF3038_02124 [Akkermansia sp. KLE1797]KXU53541.1 hypothetical protein HMPREF3039_02263 [Akkermansia sp. KLE1798]KZA05735.1 hypothetical protein HMPREF1326_00561 [Akkermansia sp. KLE1605]